MLLVEPTEIILSSNDFGAHPGFTNRDLRGASVPARVTVRWRLQSSCELASMRGYDAKITSARIEAQGFDTHAGDTRGAVAGGVRGSI